MAKPSASQTCPLCGQAVASGEGLEALGKHFEVCPKTERASRADPARKKE